MMTSETITTTQRLVQCLRCGQYTNPITATTYQATHEKELSPVRRVRLRLLRPETLVCEYCAWAVRS